MTHVIFDLRPTHTMDELVADKYGNKVHNPFPHIPGIYIIYNRSTNNRYVGITTDMNKRFASRFGALFELGFDKKDVMQIQAYTGIVTYTYNNINYFSPHSYKDPTIVTSNGQGNIDYEELLIRTVFLRLGEIYGGHITNTRKTKPFQCVVDDIHVTLRWDNGPNDEIIFNIPAGNTL